MPKKKKTQLKPVERGFATSSIPKKTVAEEEKSVAPQSSTEEPPLTEYSKGHEPSTQKNSHSEADNVSLFLDKYQDKVNKEVTRLLKSVEFDRNVSSTYERIDLYSTHIDDIISLMEKISPCVQTASEDKSMPQMGMIYDVLRKLGFDEERVSQCLRMVDVLDIDAAYEWLCLRSPEGESNIKTQRPFCKPILSSTKEFCFRVSTFIPNSSDPPPPLLQKKKKPKPKVVAIDRTISNPEIIHFDEYDDPNEEYAHIKGRIYELEAFKKDINLDHLSQLKARLDRVQDDYFFREKEGKALFSVEKAKIDARLLERKLAAAPLKTPAKENLSKADYSSQPQPPPESKVINDIFEDAEEDEVGIFNTLLEGPPQSEMVEGIQIQLRDVERPKNWTGRTAKLLLSDVVKKLDRFAVISYSALPDSRTSIAKRAAVSIRWNDGFIGEWCMETVGCFTADQAEEYISTVALHGIAFQQSEGFVVSSNSGATSIVQANIRFLPPLLKDLWDVLECQRKDVATEENRRIWSVLYDTYEKRKADDIVVTKPAPTISGSSDLPKNIGIHSEMARSDRQVQDLFHSRRTSLAYAAMLEQREKLPIASYRAQILATINSSQVVVLSGDTGCGKSTQLPSFILEDSLSRGNYCKIYCAEPRRISTISLAQRVSAELGDPSGAVGTTSSLIGYSIRLESNTSATSRLIFATYGILLRLLEKRRTAKDASIPFDDVTHIIIDEVHERNLDSDFLLIILRSLMETNRNLKLVLMSATLNAQKLSEFFDNCPVISVPGRTFPVDVHFLEDAVELTKWSIDKDSPLARRDEQVKKLRQSDEILINEDIVEADEPVLLEKRYSQSTRDTIALLDERQIPYELIIRLLERLCFEDATLFEYSRAILVFVPGLAEIRRLHDMLSDHALFGVEEEYQIFPLHSTMTNEQQSSVFELLPLSTRKIVISTNIAETGVTIPDITCVIDTGRHREMRYDEKRQISRLIDTFITKSNAKQRKGRAGRVQPGFCFHLFTKSRYEKYMQDDPSPEMLRLSLSSIALKIKTLDINLGSSVEDVLSRALDPPLETNVQRAVQALIEVKALTPNQDITPMGRILSRLPTDIYLGKVLLSGAIFECLDPALTIAAALNSKSPFITPFGKEQEAKKAHESFQIDNSDFLTIHRAFSSWRNACSDLSYARHFCRQNFLSFQNLQQIEDLRQQFFGYLVESGFIKLAGNEMDEFSRLRAGRNKTRFINIPPDLNRNSNNPSFINSSLVFGLYPKLLFIDAATGQLRTLSNNQVAYFHPSSVNMGKKLSDFTGNFLCYFTIMQSKRLYAWETGPVDNLALALLCGECDFKLFSGSIVIDHKIKFRLTPKACAAFKQLRQQLHNIISLKTRSIALKPEQVEWHRLALAILSRINPNEVNLELTID